MIVVGHIEVHLIKIGEGIAHGIAATVEQSVGALSVLVTGLDELTGCLAFYG